MQDSSSLGSIRFLTGPMAGQTYIITKPTITLGRDPTSDVPVSDPSVSRHHAQILLRDDSWIIQKMAQQNTITLNKREVQQSPLLDRDTVGLGAGTTFLFEVAPRAVGQSNNSPTAQVQLPERLDGIQLATPVAQVGQTPQVPGWSEPKSNAHRFQAPPSPPFTPSPPSGLQGRLDATQHALDPFAANQPNSGAFNQSSGLPSIEVSTNTDPVKHVFMLSPDKQVFDIGRDPSNDVVVNRPTVSGFHAQIIREGNQLVLIHPHPKRGQTLNGLLYQGKNVRGNEQFRHVLVRGDVFRITDENGTLVSLAYNDGSGQLQEALPVIHPIPLDGRPITLGRAPSNTVVLKHPQVSANHARIEFVRGNYRIIDANSTNFVYINGKRITHPHNLIPGDEIRIGPFKLTFTGTQITQHDESNGIRIDALHLKKTGNNNTVLVNDISIAIPPRKFVALVGGSGAGKSTLMDALNGLRPAQKGTVLYNGTDYYSHLAAFSTQLGYVPQEDIIHRELTVERALYYAARLRLPEDLTEAQIKERIDDVLEDVEMKHRRKLLVSKLSGGQRKRVSIALELLANPNIFFLDEPTSGLDPGLDRKMMLLLRKLADKGHTIVLVTHATNNINACDYICFLCQGGRLAYFGPPNEAKDYFGKTDFAEIYSALEPTEENKNIPAEAEAKFRQSEDFRRYVEEPLKQGSAGNLHPLKETAEITSPKRGNPWKQFLLLSGRYIELLWNDRVNLLILILQAPIIAVILYFMTASDVFHTTSIVGCYSPTNPKNVVSCQLVKDALADPNNPVGLALHQRFVGKTDDEILEASVVLGVGGNAQKTLFIMAFAVVMFGCINGAREIVKEAAIYRRERAVNLGIAPYVFSKFVVLGVLSILQAFILVFVVNFKAPFDELHGIIFSNVVVELSISMALTSLAGLMIGLLISAVVPNNDRAMSLSSLPLVLQVIFAGVVFNLDETNLQIPAAFASVRWAMAAMGSSVGLHNNQVLTDNFSNIGILFPTTVSNPHTIDPTAHLLLCWGILVAMIIAQGVLIAWFLKRKDVRR